MPIHTVIQKYKELQRNTSNGYYNPTNTRIIGEVFIECLRFLGSVEREPLISKVANKSYFAFKKEGKISRAINDNLFYPDEDSWIRMCDVLEQNRLDLLTKEDLAKALYTIAISFCASIDLLKNGDQKTPGTFFEYFIAYLFTWRVGTEPNRSIRILSLDEAETRLRTDFTFNLGVNKQKFHMPIKTSTRERAIMLWAHQKLLDGVYGIEKFMGTPVCLAETKVDKKKKEVIEICTPEQWRVYQLYIAKLKRVYYLDVPNEYVKLNYDFPPIVIKPFHEFFYEWSNLAPS